jgi:predicted RNA binding protein YcfA (HicA-like mRNA interferase family)
MPKLYSSKQILAVLQKHQFSIVSQKGSHIKLHKKGFSTLTTVVPANRKEMPYGTFKAILMQTELSVKDFEK